MTEQERMGDGQIQGLLDYASECDISDDPLVVRMANAIDQLRGDLVSTETDLESVRLLLKDTRTDLSAARADAEAKGKLLAEAVEALEIDRIVGMFVCVDGITLEQCASLLKPYGFVGYSPEDWSEQKKQDTLSRLTSATQPGAGEKGWQS